MHLGLVFGFQFSVFGTTEQTKTKTKTTGLLHFSAMTKPCTAAKAILSLASIQDPISNIPIYT